MFSRFLPSHTNSPSPPSHQPLLYETHNHLRRLAVTILIIHTLVRIRAGPNATSTRIIIRSYIIEQQRFSSTGAILGRRIRLAGELTHDIQIGLRTVIHKAIARTAQRLETRHAQVLDRGGGRVEVEVRAEVVVDGIAVRAGIHGACVGKEASLIDEPILVCRVAHSKGRGGGVDFFDGDVGGCDHWREGDGFDRLGVA